VQFDWTFFTEQRFVESLISGLKTTLVLSGSSAAGALLIGVLLLLAKTGGPRTLRIVCRWYTDVARNVPVLITLFFLYFGLTSVFPPSEYAFLRTPYLGEIICVAAISLVMGAFVSEVLRQGVESVPAGQFEAALACGLNGPNIYRQVVIPPTTAARPPGAFDRDGQRHQELDIRHDDWSGRPHVAWAKSRVGNV
jgi:octopine/nopaline transport system permease protein